MILPRVSHDASFDDCAAGNASTPTYTDFAIGPKAVDGWIGYMYSCHAEAAWALQMRRFVAAWSGDGRPGWGLSKSTIRGGGGAQSADQFATQVEDVSHVQKH